MLFAIGTRVELVHTGDFGVVDALLDEGMVNVRIESTEMVIPVSTDDLVRAESSKNRPIKAKIVEGKKENSPKPPPPIPIETQYTILKSQGVQLAFEPVSTREGVTEKYHVFIINDTQYQVIYSVKFLVNYRKPIAWNGKLNSMETQFLGEMFYDDLNESPVFEIECRWVTTESVGTVASKSLKIRPKSFFGSLRTAPLLNKQTHLYRLFEKPETARDAKEEHLKDYTAKNAKPRKFSASNNEQLSLHDSAELAEFQLEIDLHIDKLHDNWEKLNNAEILKIQLSHFESFLNKAIRLGVSAVFIIHGVGKGRLKNEIATRLMQNPDVVTFKNEYHPRYGWGATEVLL